ncbi:hypothetical protein [Spirosoma validum]|uniref:Uncharacterized protein n=1 Tax=Spirosoma validum TaxID=2771355 RepID=A0A927GDS4_9BACT|nr:hypothetical protein [Spirosoma validum]MBD2753968.1 hypothetical protein [Spirosoma validum]
MSLIEILDLREIDTIKLILIVIAVILHIIFSHLFQSIISKLSIIEILDFREIGIFNSREIAIFICVIIPFCIIYFRSSEVRTSIKSVINAFFVKNIIIVYILLLLNLIIVISILYFIGFWKQSLWKDAIIWLVFTGSVIMYNISKPNTDKKYFKKIVLETVTFSAIIEFIIGQHTFNIFIEILLTAIGFFIGGLLLYSKEEKYKDVRKLLNIVTIIIAGIMLYYSLSKIIQNIISISIVEKAEEFSLSIILTLCFIPFFYILYLYMNYKSRFSAIKSIIKDDDILLYAKKQALLNFKDDKESLVRWTNTLFLEEPKTKQDVKKSINNIKELKLVEQNPPNVDSNEGWSPHKSKDFLKDSGIATGFYNKCYGDEWQASSPYIELNKDSIDNSETYCMADNVAYYVSGNSTIVIQLKLILHINSKNDEKLSVNKFHEYVKHLYRSALDNDLPNAITKAIINGKSKNLKISNKTISVIKYDYVDRNKGYRIAFSIVHK